MPQLGDFLNRFRPAGAPGAATRVGVPADREAELSAELDPVLGLLAATEAECARTAAEAAEEAHRIAEEAGRQAARIAADGQGRAQVARSEAAAAVLAAARVQAAQTERAAAERIQSSRGPADDEVGALIADAIRLVLAMADVSRVSDADRPAATGGQDR